MSQHLDSLLDAQRRHDIARNDAQMTDWHREIAAGIAGATKLDEASAMGDELQQLADQIAAKNHAAPARASSVRAPQRQVYAPAISAYAGCLLCGDPRCVGCACYRGGCEGA